MKGRHIMKVYLSESIDETAYQLLSRHMDNVLSAYGIEEAK